MFILLFCFTGSGIHMNAMRATLCKNCLAKKFVLESDSKTESDNGKKKFLDPNPK
jgi:hypothetical protein